MRDVVQHCLNKNPDITWNTVITAAKSANEVNVVRHILDKHSGKHKGRYYTLYYIRFRNLQEYM